VKDPSEIVKPGQKVSVTVTEIDLARNRIALSMRSKPEIGARSTSAQRPNSGGPRGRANSAPPPPKSSKPVNDDWFSAAMNKKR